MNNCSGRYSKTFYVKEDLKKEIFKYNHLDSKFFRDFAKKELDVRYNIVKYIEYFYLLKNNKIEKQFKTRIISSFKIIIKIVKKKIKYLINLINYY